MKCQRVPALIPDIDMRDLKLNSNVHCNSTMDAEIPHYQSNYPVKCAIPNIAPIPIDIKSKQLRPCSLPKGQRHDSAFPLACALLPHLHVLDREAPLVSFAPCGKPIVHAVKELLGRCGTLVAPRLVPNAVRKEPVRAADSDVQDEVEGLVKRRAVSSRLYPRIVEGRVVHEGLAETAAVPHGLVELDKEDLLPDS
jgi:hypothetical protein